MTSAITLLLSVMFLTDPHEVIDAAAALSASREADRGESEAASAAEVKSVRVTSQSSDFDRNEGVVMFEGDVVVRYSADYTMCADRLFMFLSGSNELSRVVALGNVVVSNETRVGTCAMATYRRRKHEIEMFWNQRDTLAHLTERGEDASEITGTRIRFWLDAEQVEVEDSSISFEQTGVKGIK